MTSILKYRVDENGCWVWKGKKNAGGYGISGKAVKLYNTPLMHRVSWMVHRGLIPAGQCVLHRCDNRPCLNPDHLFLGTKSENVWDAQRKGRCRGPVRADDGGKWARYISRTRARLGMTSKEFTALLGFGTNNMIWRWEKRGVLPHPAYRAYLKDLLDKKLAETEAALKNKS